MSADVDLLIVGAGPAGMSAAVATRRLGLSVIVVDENAEPGGQIYRRVLSNAARPKRTQLLGADYSKGLALARDFVACGADLRAQSTVFEISEDGSASIVSPGQGAYVVTPQATLIATGASERAFPVPGWTLPGVMTAGAAQTLLKSTGQIPEGRIVLAGGGPLLWLVAHQLLSAGAEVAAVLSFASRADQMRSLPGALAAWRSIGAIAKGARWIASLSANGVKIVHGVRIDGIDESGTRKRVRYRAANKEASEDADVVLVHAGVIPSVQASMSLALDHVWNDLQFCWQPVTDDWGTTSNPRVMVAGDGAGISGADDAVRAGELAALGLAARMRRIGDDERDARAAPLLAARARQFALRRFLDALYVPPTWLRTPPDDSTLVCRCEQVSARAIRDAVRLGALGPNQVKAFVRAGMGPCQGRMCAQTVAAVIADERGVDCSQVPTQRVRPPLKPLHLGDLADMPHAPGEQAESAQSITAGLLHAPEEAPSGAEVNASH